MENYSFKTVAFGGFDKQDVVRYLEQAAEKNAALQRAHEEESEKLRGELEELREQEPGFRKNSQWLQYACEEDAFNSLEDFLNGTITGGAFDREKQIEAFCGITANYDGTSGEKIYEFVRNKLRRRQEELT